MFVNLRTRLEQDWQYMQVQYRRPAFEAFNMRNAFITLDEAFDYVGDNSRYQQRITLLLSIQFLFYSFFVMGMPYIFQQPTSYKCNHQPVSETEICSCPYTVEIDGYRSLNLEFRLICSKSQIPAYLQSLFFIGQMIGGFVFPILADVFGRRRILLFGSFLGALAITLCGIALSLDILYILFFTAGFGLSGYETVVYVYITEISALRFRSIATSVLLLIWSSSMLIYPFIIDLVGSWREVILFFIGMPFLLAVMLSYFFYVESPRWLAQKQRYPECRKVFRYMSIFNKRRPFEFNFMEEMEQQNSKYLSLNATAGSHYIDQAKQYNRFTYWSLLSQSKLLRLTIILICVWFLRYFAYYSIQFSVDKFGINMSLAVRILAITEVLTALSSFYFKLKFKRIPQLQLCLAMMVISSFFSFVQIPSSCSTSSRLCWQEMLLFFSAILLKFALTFYISLISTYTGEAYVTSVRSYGYGFCMTLGQLGSTMAPVYVQYITKSHTSPFTIIMVLAIFIGCLSFLLPETFKQQIHDNIREDVITFPSEIPMRSIEMTDLARDESQLQL